MVFPGSTAAEAVSCCRMAGFKVSKSVRGCLFISLVPRITNTIVPVNRS